MEKTNQQKLADLEQRIHKMQMERKRLKIKMADDERKKRNHALIRLAATYLTHFPPEVEQWIINADDDKIDAWVHKQFRTNDTSVFNKTDF